MRLRAPGPATLVLSAALGLAVPAAAMAQSLGDPASQPPSPEDLRSLSIAQLAGIDVSSVSKTSESLSQAPAAIYVITHEEIARSGATTVPEILRLAPNLEVFQTSASHYVITARGFSGNSQAQSFSNKLLVLIDGRSVYTPLFSGVYWDMQDVLPEDIDRIEVISGPGSTLWGANAVNGVINIITRSANQTQGGLADVGGGNLSRIARARYGGRVGDKLDYRIYVSALDDSDTRNQDGSNAGDGWTRVQGGFRLDWAASDLSRFTVQGDAYEGLDDQAGPGNEHIEGRNLMARWTRDWAGGANLQVQAYYDRTGRATENAGGRFDLDTYDLDLQHSFALGGANAVVWGGGLRVSRYDIRGSASLMFEPPSRSLTLANLFAQDTLSITSATRLSLGVKLEDDPYSGLSLMPNARLSWTPSAATLFWAAASRAIRSPTPFDRDVVEKSGGAVLLLGDSDFEPEKLTAFEIGGRFQPTSRVSFSVSGFYNIYDDLRTIEYTPVTFVPLHWDNLMGGHTYGLEAWGSLAVASWWRLSAGYSLLEKDLSFDPGATGILGLAQAGDDPEHQAQLKSSMNLGPAVTLDADLRYVSALPDPHVPAYAEMNARLAWAVTDRLQLALSGANLFHDRHLEFAGGNWIPRSYFVDLRLRF